MERRLIVLVFILIVVFCFSVLSEAQEKSKQVDSRKAFEVYRVVGKGKDLKEAREDAYQNAIIEFLKKNVYPKDLKNNSEKILKEIFPSKKILDFIESYKVISPEDSGDSVKIVMDVVIRVQKLIDTLQKINVPLKEDYEKKAEESTNGNSTQDDDTTQE